MVFDPKIYMKMAIDQMENSIAEPRADGNISPKVGAVIVKPNGDVETACRGELRYGDHAEFTLLERKNRSALLEKSVLFTTLEPCSPGARKHPKLSCAERIVLARITEVWIGIEDPYPTVGGEGIKYLEKHDIKVRMFDRELQQLIEQSDKGFLEQAKRKAKEDRKETEVNLLRQSVVNADFEGFSIKALQKFLDESNLGYSIDESEFQSFLTNVGVMELDENANIYRPTGLGILLFGKRPRDTFQNASFKAFVEYGNDKIESKRFDQALVLVPDLVENWIKKALPVSKDTSSFKRKDVPDFPVEVLREAVINAIVHRDYEIKGAKSSLEIDDDKIVVKSPGKPLPSISLKQLNTYSAPSISRNPVITYVFNLMNYAEETGFGMKSIKSLNETYKLPLPEYSLEEPFLVLSFPRNFDAVRKVSHHANISKLNDEELQGYEYIKSKGTVTRKRYQEELGIESDKKAERHLKKMVDLNLIRRAGAGPSTYYEIIPT